MKTFLNILKYLVLIFSIDVVFVWSVVLYVLMTGLLASFIPINLFFCFDILFEQLINFSSYLYLTKIKVLGFNTSIYNFVDIIIRSIIILDILFLSKIYNNKNYIREKNENI